MKESGWLTRSLEQNIPYNLDSPGKIRDAHVKSAFLNLINNIEEEGSDPEEILIGLFQRSIYEKNKRDIVLINPIESESKFTISDIMNYLVKLFYYDYKSRGASILPVIALYSIYSCITYYNAYK